MRRGCVADLETRQVRLTLALDDVETTDTPHDEAPSPHTSALLACSHHNEERQVIGGDEGGGGEGERDEGEEALGGKGDNIRGRLVEDKVYFH
ncbi:hypothetical protein BHE74_00013696 [Ensete ventricosum]|uniref:Uncharacterized protein n=1 Tax=Ensete ventricosum TaxID=4639 RepID=A0A444G719_ENSVE|nr:hypothetical protein GW17_00004717 [Ensete ventricosum]RWW78097.1 hypothetical protein BHE74_00013696 [Ensete ventricosum]RZR72752.1 hypothetical protein BHM03_00016510 [Ensete ventricosum]